MKNYSLLFIVFLFASAMLTGQTYQVQSAKSSMKVEGTSNVHDWNIVSNQVTGNIQVTKSGNTINALRGMTLTLPTESLKSNRSGMDRNTFRALKSDRAKTITYTVTSVQSLRSTGANTYAVRANGQLTAAGVTKDLPIDFTIQTSGNTLTVKGEKTINMKTWNIDPPTALMGSIRTGENVKIIFNGTFN
ncbi:MAG: YceI family protein [Weeksellaceae bacterium]|nr:YceI family protein [Weeksellaceae bacterium]